MSFYDHPPLKFDSLAREISPSWPTPPQTRLLLDNCGFASTSLRHTVLTTWPRPSRSHRCCVPRPPFAVFTTRVTSVRGFICPPRVVGRCARRKRRRSSSSGVVFPRTVCLSVLLLVFVPVQLVVALQVLGYLGRGRLDKFAASHRLPRDRIGSGISEKVAAACSSSPRPHPHPTADGWTGCCSCCCPWAPPVFVCAGLVVFLVCRCCVIVCFLFITTAFPFSGFGVRLNARGPRREDGEECRSG